MLAKNFALQLKCDVSKLKNFNFGQCFTYNEAMLGRIKSDGSYVMIEEFINGNFCKYINNDGSICQIQEKSELVEKAECLVHFTYEKSNHNLMLLDIQGSDFTLYDPEIATVLDAVDTNNLHFTMGNMSVAACSNFSDRHVCNKYCKALNLDIF